MQGIEQLAADFDPLDQAPEGFVARARLSSGDLRSVRVPGLAPGAGDLAIFVLGGRLAAIDAVCPHQGGRLELGAIEDVGKEGRVICPRHGWCFDLADGFCEDIGDFGVQAYHTIVKEGIVYVGKARPQPSRE